MKAFAFRWLSLKAKLWYLAFNAAEVMLGFEVEPLMTMRAWIGRRASLAYDRANALGQAEIAELEAENEQLKAETAEYERQTAEYTRRADEASARADAAEKELRRLDEELALVRKEQVEELEAELERLRRERG